MSELTIGKIEQLTVDTSLDPFENKRTLIAGAQYNIGAAEENLQNIRHAAECGLKMAQAQPVDAAYAETFQYIIRELDSIGITLPSPR